MRSAVKEEEIRGTNDWKDKEDDSEWDGGWMGMDCRKNGWQWILSKQSTIFSSGSKKGERDALDLCAMEGEWGVGVVKLGSWFLTNWKEGW